MVTCPMVNTVLICNIVLILSVKSFMKNLLSIFWFGEEEIQCNSDSTLMVLTMGPVCMLYKGIACIAYKPAAYIVTKADLSIWSQRAQL